MKYLLTLTLLGLMTAAWCNALAPKGEPVTVKNWRERVIVVSANADEQQRFGAKLLADTLGKIFNHEFPVVNDAAGRPAIVVGGATEAADQAYRIAMDGDNLVLTGGKRGPIYAVIALLEEDFGCRWYHLSDPMQTPEVTADEFPVVPRAFVPPFEVREVLYRDAWADVFEAKHAATGTDWAGFNRMQPISFYAKVLPPYGGGLANPQFFCHTYHDLVPADKYFATNPEFFPMRGGKRWATTYADGQLCYTAKGLPEVIAARLLEVIAADPTTRIYSVSANDNVFDNCECATCTPLIAAENVSGAQLKLANRVAELVMAHYPEIRITTLAYVNSQVPPPHVKPGDNTAIIYAPIRERGGALMLLPLEKMPKIVNEAKAWNKITKHLYLWDYIDSGVCNPLPTPFPNFDVLESNWPFLLANGFTGVFLEAAEISNASLGELKTWYCVKKLWNPEWKLDALLEDFIVNFYGPAAPEMREYVELQRDAWRRFYAAYEPGQTLSFSPKEVTRMRELLGQALAKADGNEALQRKLNRELFTVLTLVLNGYPDRKNPEPYEKSLQEAQIALAVTGITVFSSNLPAKDVFAKWQAKVDNVRNGNPLPLYCDESVVLNNTPVIYFGAAQDDKAAVNGRAYRQPGSERNDWGLQWSFADLLAQAPNQQVYVARVRYRTELASKHKAGSPLFQVGLWKSGMQNVQIGTVNMPAEDPANAYTWGYLFRVYMYSPAAEGCFYTAPGIGTTDKEALWFDYFEFIPIEKFKDKKLAESLPLITL